MAGYFMNALDWGAWERFLASPASELTGHLANSFKRPKDRWRLSAFPDDRAYEKALAAFLESDDWYRDLDYEDSHKVEILIQHILALSFDNKIKLHYPLEFEDEFKLYDSVYWDCIDVLWSGTKLPKKRNGEMTWVDFDRSARRIVGGFPAGGYGVPEFGLRPFRHPDFDLAAMAKAHHSGNKPVYRPSYGMHPPEDVAKMLDMIDEAEPRLAYLAPECRTEFDFLRTTLAQTVEKQGGLCVRTDT